MYLMNHGVKVFRKQKTGTGLNSEYVELKTFQRCLVMPMDEKASAQNGFGYRDWETDRKSTRLNSSHSAKSRMPSSA